MAQKWARSSKRQSPSPPWRGFDQLLIDLRGFAGHSAARIRARAGTSDIIASR